MVFETESIAKGGISVIQLQDKFKREVNSKGYLVDKEGNIVNKEGNVVI